MLQAALAYAAKNWPVFPCNGKRPCVLGGFHAATLLVETITLWWSELFPKANIGIPTGSRIGAWVLDVDAPDGHISLARFEAEHGKLPLTLEQRTGGGGRHLFFKLLPGQIVRNSASKVAPGIDVRGEGGYIVAAPSLHESGEEYGFVNDAPIVEAPDALMELVLNSPPTINGDDCVKAVLEAHEGTRNDTLNKAAFRLGKLVAVAGIGKAEAVTKLLRSADVVGLPADEAAKTIESGLNAGIAEQLAKNPQHGSLVVVTHKELSQLDIPKRKRILDPVIFERGLAMLFAGRGIGKSWVALAIAIAIACGRTALGRWIAPEPRTVLYIDGEMSSDMIQERLGLLYPEGDSALIPDGNLRILTPDLQSGPMPNLATLDGQQKIAPYLEGVDVVIIDNLATLATNGSENEVDSWRPFQTWLLELRRQGKSVLLVHHAGKNGSQRGTSAREDVLDIVISLERPNDYQSEQGARFLVQFTKNRGLFGDEVKSFEVALDTDEPGAVWTTSEMDEDGDANLEKVRELNSQGHSIRAIGDMLGISKTTVGRLVKKL